MTGGVVLNAAMDETCSSNQLYWLVAGLRRTSPQQLEQPLIWLTAAVTSTPWASKWSSRRVRLGMHRLLTDESSSLS